MATKAIPARFTHDRRTIQGVEVFAVGNFVDSMGRDLEVTADDLDAMVESFNNGSPPMVPVKFGHTSDAFNTEQVAELLGVTPGLITGEGDEGDGAILPGTVTKLARRQNKLVADLDVISPVADMIMDGLLKGISIEKPFKAMVLSAVTLLGGELPAIADLVPLQAATILKEASVLAFSMNTDNATITPRTFHTHVERMRSLSWFAMDLGLAEGATITDVIRRLQQLSVHDEEESIMDEKGIRALLSIKDDVDILEAITALKEKSTPASAFGPEIRAYFKLGADAPDSEILTKLGVTAPEHNGPDPKAMSEFAKEVKEVKSLLVERDARVMVLERENTVRRFAVQTANFSLVQGTPEELAVRLADIKEKMGDDAVAAQVADWEKTQEYGEEAGIAVSLGSNAPGAPGDWDAALTQWKKDHPREKNQRQIQWDADAVKGVMEEQPELYKGYYKGKRIAIPDPD